MNLKIGQTNSANAMKIILFFFSFLPLAVFAQTKADYENALGKFMRFYNNNQSDSIDAMFLMEMRNVSAPDKVWSAKKTAAFYKECGSMKSYSYLGRQDKKDPKSVIVFKAVFEKSTHALAFTLEKEPQTGDYKLGTFRFKTISDETDKMLKKAK